MESLLVETTTNRESLVLWLDFALFLLAFVGAIGSYFKALSDIRQAIATAKDEIRKEMRQEYTSKEETKFIHESLGRIEAQVSAIFRKLEDK